ncbi:hypothetical protein CRYUN_Cryun23aG0149100 [Craigia yunnanensis]
MHSIVLFGFDYLESLRSSSIKELSSTESAWHHMVYEAKSILDLTDGLDRFLLLMRLCVGSVGLLAHECEDLRSCCTTLRYLARVLGLEARDGVSCREDEKIPTLRKKRDVCGLLSSPNHGFSCLTPMCHCGTITVSSREKRLLRRMTFPPCTSNQILGWKRCL